MFLSRLNTSYNFSEWFFILRAHIIMSSKYMNSFNPFKPNNSVFIRRWNVAGTPFKPNGTRVNSKYPLSVKNAVFPR